MATYTLTTSPTYDAKGKAVGAYYTVLRDGMIINTYTSKEEATQIVEALTEMEALKKVKK